MKEEMLNNLKQKVGQLQKEIDGYKEREFSLQKFKDDNAAIQFYTGFPNYKALVAEVAKSGQAAILGSQKCTRL